MDVGVFNEKIDLTLIGYNRGNINNSFMKTFILIFFCEMVCAICLSEEAKEPTRLGCEHIFCFSCIMSWFIKGQERQPLFYCPCCRAKVLDLVVRERSFQSDSFRLLCNAWSYLYVEHEGFPTQEAAIGELRVSLTKFDDPE